MPLTAAAIVTFSIAIRIGRAYRNLAKPPAATGQSTCRSTAPGAKITCVKNLRKTTNIADLR
jgi:hypothetical protein